MFSSPTVDNVLVFFFCVTLGVAAISDLRSFRIPNRISVLLALLFCLHALVSPTPIAWAETFGISIAIFATGFVLFSIGMIGGGDVKLLSAASLWAGPLNIGTELLVMALAGGVLAMIALGVQFARRFATGGVVGVILPDPAIAAPKLPYGIAIAAGGAAVALKLLPG